MLLCSIMLPGTRVRIAAAPSKVLVHGSKKRAQQSAAQNSKGRFDQEKINLVVSWLAVENMCF